MIKALEILCPIAKRTQQVQDSMPSIHHLILMQMFPLGAYLASPIARPVAWLTCPHQLLTVPNLNVQGTRYSPAAAHLQMLTIPHTLSCMPTGQVSQLASRLLLPSAAEQALQVAMPPASLSPTEQAVEPT